MFTFLSLKRIIEGKEQNRYERIDKMPKEEVYNPWMTLNKLFIPITKNNLQR